MINVNVHTEISIHTSFFKNRGIAALGNTVRLARIKIGALGVDVIIPLVNTTHVDIIFQTE